MSENHHGLRIGILGEFVVFDSQGPIEVQTHQVGRVGTLLAAWPCRMVERSRIVSALWGEHPPPSYVNAVQVYVSKLRNLLGTEAIRSHPNGYSMDMDPSCVDVHLFEESVRESSQSMAQGDGCGARDHAERALALWRDAPFRDLTDPELLAQRERLIELREQAIETRLLATESLAVTEEEWNQVVAAAKEQVVRQPLRENGHATLIRALTQVGRVPEAISAFRDSENVLQNLAGVAPGASVTGAYAAALATRAGGTVATSTPLV